VRPEAAMPVVTLIGASLVVIGVVEFVLFRYLGARRENIARRRRFLDANAAFNVVLGAVLIAIDMWILAD
jgi:threonine/homoserine/homoserine lactone efflux protein